MRRKCSAQGVALIMIVAILMVLSTIGVVFIRTTSIEYNVAMNYEIGRASCRERV